MEDRRAALAGEQGERAKWHELVEVEKEACAKLLPSTDLNREQRKNAAPFLRQWWMAWSMLMIEVAKAEGRFRPFPAEALLRTARLTSDLGRGILSDPITDASIGNRRPASWGERYDRACAAAYLSRASQDFGDRSQNKTVAAAFGFGDAKKSAQRLKKQANELQDEFPWFWRMPASKLLHALEECGTRYKTAGRTEGAIAERAKRQQ